MSYAKTRLNIVCLLLALLLAKAPAQQVRLDDPVHPIKQSVSLRTDPAESEYRGSTVITLEVEEPLTSFRLHALDLVVEEARLEGVAEPLKVESGGPFFKLTAPVTVKPGKHDLHITFTAPFNTHSVGLYKFTDGDKTYLSTQFEMQDARRCFPCFDEPGFKIPFQLTIEAPSGLRVYNNSPEVKKTAEGDWTRHEFAATPPIPPYLVAMAIGPYEDRPVNGLSVPGRIVTTAGKIELGAFSAEHTPEIVGALEDYFGIPYAYQKLDQLGITEFPFGAMENAGLVTYREDILLLNEANAVEEDRIRTLMVVAHELSHQWFGNLVTMKWWDDLWLNEAFATWMSTKIINRLHPELEYFLDTPQNHVMGSDARLSTKPIRKPIRTERDIMDGLGLAYNKGAAVLNMVEAWLGEKTFQKGIRSYLTEHRFANAQAADLWGALGKASGKDVEAVLKSFTEQSGYPLLTLSVEGPELTVSQQRFSLAGAHAPAQSWTLPVFLRYGRGEVTRHKVVLLDSQSMTCKLDFEPDWVFPDDGAVGYYRWRLSPFAIKRLAFHNELLSNREKLAFLYNVGGLFEAGIISAGERLALTEPFLSDAHPLVVTLALSEVDSMRIFVDSHNNALWTSYLKNTLAPVAARFGTTPRKGEHVKVESLRPLLLEMLARDIHSQEVIETAREEAQAYLSGKPVDPALASVYLLIAARHGDVAMVDQVKDALAAASDPKRRTTLLETLGSFGRPGPHKHALDLMLDDVVTPSDLRILLTENSQEEYRRRQLQSWLEANFPALREKLPTAFLAVIPASLEGARDREQLDAILNYFGSQPDPDGTLKRELEKLKEEVEARIDKIERERESFDHYLRMTTRTTAETSPLEFKSQWKDDRYFVQDGTLHVRSSRGIGGVSISPKNKEWPGLRAVRFEYEDGQGMARLEGLRISTPSGELKTPHKEVKDGAVEVELTDSILGEGSPLEIHWVDFYR